MNISSNNRSFNEFMNGPVSPDVILQMDGYNLVKAASKFLVESIQKINCKPLMMLKLFVKMYRLWLGFLQLTSNRK